MKPTPGPWYVDEYSDVCANGEDVAQIASEHQHAQDDAELIADAGNTYHATGLTPSELAAQRDELLAALRNLFDALDDIRGIDLRDYKPNEILAAENVITNATKGEK